MKLQILNIFFAAGCTLTPIAGSAATKLTIFTEYGSKMIAERDDSLKYL